MTSPLRALSADQIRQIIRAHPAVFAEVASAGATDARDIAAAVVDMVRANPAVVDSIVAAGLNVTTDQAANMGLLKWLTATSIAAKTADSINPRDLVDMLYDELSRLSMGSGALQ
jgi:hypothetical protein